MRSLQRESKRFGRSGVGLVMAGFLAAAVACEISTERPYGVALHLHGSMSEGKASMRGHATAARQLAPAVDVLWWTDHDWRIAAHTYVNSFDFEEGLEESELVPAPYRKEQWNGRSPLLDWTPGFDSAAPPPPDSLEEVKKVWRIIVPEESLPGERSVAVSTRQARNGLRSLHMKAAGTRPGVQKLALGFDASRRRHIASLASGVRLRLSVLPVRIDPGARVIVRVGLSQPGPEQGLRMDYLLSPGATGSEPPAPSRERVEIETADRVVDVVTVPVSATTGRWNDWVLELSEDAEALGVGGGDNALVSLSLVVEVRGRARAEIYFDSLAIERDKVGSPLFAEAKRMAGALADDALMHHVGQEISYAAHLNAYGSGVPLADADAHPHGYTPQAAVAFVHEHGGLVSLNHYFGVMFDRRIEGSPRAKPYFEAALERLIGNRAYGVDLLEVGYRARGYGLAAHLALWDGLARAGIRVVGVGVSDSHDAHLGWTEGPNNFITWVYARSDSQADLLAGLAAGRAYFGDPTRFDGELDLRAAGGGRMGDLLLRVRGPAEVTVQARGLRGGQSIRLVLDGEPVGEFEPKGPEWTRRVLVDVQGPTFLRFEVLEAGEAVALSNPLYFDLVPSGAGEGGEQETTGPGA